MSENREPEMMEKETGSQEHEPIESIEQTVADLKKKIEELTEEQEKAAEETEKDTGDRIAAFTENAKEIVSASIDEIRSKAEDLTENADLQKTIAYIRDNAMKAVTMTKEKIEEIRQDPKTQENTEKAMDAVRSVGEKVNEHARKAGEYISDRIDDDAKETLHEACETATKALEEGTRKVVEEVSEFVNREDVQQTITKARTKATELMNRGAESLKDLFGKKDGQK